MDADHGDTRVKAKKPAPQVAPSPVSAAPKFSPQEAQLLINIARSAPTANMDAADRTRVLLDRFARWYESVNK
jgi:hypothetical protein